MGTATDWAVQTIESEGALKIIERTPEDLLIIQFGGHPSFVVAVLGKKDVVHLEDVEPLFKSADKPQLVINVPSKTAWSGAAIDFIHAQSAAFGTFGDVGRVAAKIDVGSHRDKNIGFFIDAISQHSHVSAVSYVYDRVLKASLTNGKDVVIAIIDAYNVSAEDLRNATAQFGHFDVAVKASSYGSITSPATEAAESMGAKVLTFRGLMQHLRK